MWCKYRPRSKYGNLLVGPSGFLATHTLWRKKKQLLQLSLEKRTVSKLSLKKGSWSLWRSHEASGWCCYGNFGITKCGSKPSSWSSIHWSRGGENWGQEAMHSVSQTIWMHMYPPTDTYLWPPHAWHSMVRAWDSSILNINAGCDKPVLIQ